MKAQKEAHKIVRPTSACNGSPVRNISAIPQLPTMTNTVLIVSCIVQYLCCFISRVSPHVSLICLLPSQLHFKILNNLCQFI